MDHGTPAPNVISLSQKIAERRSASPPDIISAAAPRTRVIAVTSGKGGVGKTNIVANLGFALSRGGQRVLIWDADLGLGNLDILLGVAPRWNLSHVLSGEKAIDEIMVEGPGRMTILPASSGIQELTRLSESQKERIFAELSQLLESIDVLLIDTGAGISSNVLYFNTLAREILVVVTPEPTSITDAYALMKILSLRHGIRHFGLLVNMARDEAEAEEVFRQLALVTGRFLQMSLSFSGTILSDESIPRSVRRQKVAGELFPNGRSSRGFMQLAQRLLAKPTPAIGGAPAADRPAPIEER
jgi:flagellar biosynthesis protein FlhG